MLLMLLRAAAWWQSSMYYLPSAGQSLADGLCAGGNPPCTGVLSTAQPYSNKYMVFPGTSVTALTAIANGDEEKPVVGAANQLTFESSGHSLFVAVDPFDIASGADYNAIKQGTTAYTNFANSFANFPATATAAGFAPAGCIGVINVHGEADFTESATAANYASNLHDWQSSFVSTCGAAGTLPFMVSQISAWWTGSGSSTKSTPTTGGGAAGVPLGQLDAARANIGKIYLVGPKYPWAHTGGAFSSLPHLLEPTYLRIGEQMGHALSEVIKGHYWTGVQPKAITGSGTSLAIQWYVQVPPLVIDTSIVPDRTTGTSGAYTNCYGLEVVDGSGNPVNIASCSPSIITAADTITLALATTPSGTPRIRVAYTNPGSPDAGTGNASNIRDSDPAVGRLSLANLYNWAVTSDDPKGFTDPGYPVTNTSAGTVMQGIIGRGVIVR